MQSPDEKVWFTKRKGLAESLESYAKRHGVLPSEARYAWRVEGLRCLGLVPDFIGTGARIAPGIAVPTKPTRWETDWAKDGFTVGPTLRFNLP